MVAETPAVLVVLGRTARYVASVAVAVGSLTACHPATVPRALELGDALRAHGRLLLGAADDDWPLSADWLIGYASPVVWPVDPRGATSAAVRVGLRYLDVVSGCEERLGGGILPPQITIDRVHWSLTAEVGRALVVAVVVDRDVELHLILEPVAQPLGTFRYWAEDAESARGALGFEVALDGVDDGRTALEHIARGAAVDLHVRLIVNVANAAAFGSCALFSGVLGSQGVSVWMIDGEP